ncbi:MAG: PAS domain-containing protein [Candidatus Accumulibacter similis]|nr:MAG: PAS domain-containing protein [Candidatus Accumulibacter similis]
MNTKTTVRIERRLAACIDLGSPWAAVLAQAGIAVAILDAEFTFLRVSQGYADAIGKPPDFFPGRHYFALFPHAASEAVFREVRDSGVAQARAALPARPRPGHGGDLDRWHWSLTPFGSHARAATTHYLILTIRHPAAPLAGEVGEPVGERRFRGLFEALTSGFALHEIVLDATGQACDYRFLEANPAFEAITGLDRSWIIGRCASAVMPQLDRRWMERYAAVALSGDGAQFDDYRSDLDRQYRLTAYSPEYGQVAVIYDDVTALRRPLPDVGGAHRPREGGR